MGYLLGRIGRVAYQQWATTLAERDVTPSRYKVLMALDEAGPLGQQQLAELIGIDPRNAVAVIDALVTRTLIDRRCDPEDRRRLILGLTRPGQRLTSELQKAAADDERDLLRLLSSAEQETLRQTLTTVLATHRSA